MKTDIQYLRHIQETIVHIEGFLKNVLKKDFLKDVEKQYATIRGIEIIGEAVKNLSSSFKEKYPAIRWRDIAGTRDVLIHSYFSVDLNLVWDIYERDLPKLKSQMQEILSKEIR